MKLVFFFITLLLISCSTKNNKEKIVDPSKIESNITIINSEKKVSKKATFKEKQDSLRTLLLKSKPNNNLKSSLLQELYIRNLVNQIDNKIVFKLPFNLHGLDCGAPDCYSTDVTFEIIAKKPIEFPEKIDFKLLEHGCGIENEKSQNGTFELVELSSNYVNYYSKELRSNLVILGDKRQLYYFPNTQINSIKVALIENMLANYNENEAEFSFPYQSTLMTTNEYEHFIK